MISEGVYQRKIIKQYEKDGYYVIKLSRTNKNGIPDLLCLKPVGDLVDVVFIEVKGKNGVVSPLQKFRKAELEAFGFKNVILSQSTS